MSSPFKAYPAPLHCGLYRAHIKKVPAQLSSVELELSQLRPPFDLIPVHNRSHLVSFANHISSLIEQPVQKVVTDQGNFFCVLGVAVFHKLPNKTFSLGVWESHPDQPPSLREIHPYKTPLIDFPRTDLWQDTLANALKDESRARINDDALAQAWADWAWQSIYERLIAPLDLRRLRSRIRKGLDLNIATLSMLRRLRGITYEPIPSVPRHNHIQQNLTELTELWRQSPLMAALAIDLTPEDHPGGVSARFFKRMCEALELKPKQWKLIADPKAPLLSAYKSLRYEFVNEEFDAPAVDFIQLIKLLKPTKAIDTEIWRSILSLVGTRYKCPRSYAGALESVGESLAHLVRLIERGSCPSDIAVLRKHVHLIGAWILDKGVSSISKSQRRLGWEFLRKQGVRHALYRKRLLEGGAWTVPLHPMKMGEYDIIPICNGGDLWQESVAMAHCVDTYSNLCRNGEVVMISLRKNRLERYATVALHKPNGAWLVKQISGKANKRLGKDVDEVGNFLAMLLNLTCPCSDSQPKLPHYVVKVTSNSAINDAQVVLTCHSADEALAAAQEICLASFEAHKALGLLSWLIEGMSAHIEPHCGATPVPFDPTQFVGQVFESRVKST